jgi:hypothetical protein
MATPLLQRIVIAQHRHNQQQNGTKPAAREFIDNHRGNENPQGAPIIIMAVIKIDLVTSIPELTNIVGIHTVMV